MCNSALAIILKEFLALAQIPRPSHHEEQVGQYLADWAASRGLAVSRDHLGEVIVDKPATPGHEAAPRIILQAHMDMVCVAAEGVTFDPLRDPIKVIDDQGVLRADGTSLGADDGIGIAICLYLLQAEDICHGPLRCIFTVNEEDGMSSSELPAEYLDAQYLINLDWETSGSLCNSCAGGDFFTFSRPAEWQPAHGNLLSISLSGLLGGHSGVEIDKGHANALVSVATALCLLRQRGVDFALAALSGGQARNAIPASAQAELILAAEQTELAVSVLDDFSRELRAGFAAIEPGLDLRYAVSGPQTAPALRRELGYALVGLMAAVPNNIHTMSPFIPGLVESSANLGVVTLDQTRAEFTLMARSSSTYQALQLQVICRALAAHFGFDLAADGHTPAWAVNPASKLTGLACAAYRELFGEEMVVEPVHAGLECGAFAEKNPALDMISIGPTLYDVHSPHEACPLDGVERIARLLVAILNKLA